ncbi:MAG: glycoside hydrolase [Acidobacteria bacterium]|nr:glycoside hydrolase [Acidobacteriota bacterium]
MLLLALLLLADVVPPPGVVIDHQPASTQPYIGSPTIAILPDGAYVASHDFFGAGSTQSTSAVTRVFRSTDRGRTWSQTAEISDQFWSNLFLHRGKLYLMGATAEYGRIVIRASSDGGRTWTQASYLTEDANYHTAPVPVALHGGRIWRAMEYHPSGAWGFFEAFVLSAPAKANLLDARSWKLSAWLPYPKDAPEGKHWLEGTTLFRSQYRRGARW